MKEEEIIVDYFLQVDKIVKTIRGLGEEVKQTIIVKKVLSSLPSRFNPNISSIEEMKDLDNMTMDELHGILTTCEMRIENDKQGRKQPSRHQRRQRQKNTKQVIA